MDREKIIKELHDARRYLEDKEWSDRGASPHIDAINNVLALLKEQDTLLKEYRNTIKDGYEALTNATKIIKSEPQIVRCKDCKFGFSEYGYVFCTKPFVEKGNANHKPDWFCADGEWRTDDA